MRLAKVNGETVALKDFERFAIHVLVLSTHRGDIASGGSTENSAEELAILDFIKAIAGVLEDRPDYNLDSQAFVALTSSTALVLGHASDLFVNIDGHKLAKFTIRWHDLLYTGWYGGNFKDTADKLCKYLYGPCATFGMF